MRSSPGGTRGLYNAYVDNERQREEARNALLARVIDRLEVPMAMLGFAWLALLIFDFVWGLTPTLELLSTIIWGIFVLDFLLELLVAPKKFDYLSHNWLMIMALLVPALRIFRMLQVLQIVQGTRLLRVLSSINRSMRALGASLGRHGFRYVLALTLIVTFAGAAGMYAFERTSSLGPGFRDYADALWWTAMIMSTLGSGYWPKTSEGRILCVILSLYAFSVFGYITAALATFLVGREAEQDTGELASEKSITKLHDEIARLREEIHSLSDHLPKDK